MLPAIYAVLTVLCFVGVWWVLFGGYRKNHREGFQQDIFGLKRNMGRWARPSGIDWDHPAYRQLADTINGMIRVGLRVMIFSFVSNRDRRPETFERRLQVSFRSLDENDRVRLLEFREEMHLITLKYMMWSAPVLLTVIPPISAWWMFKYRRPTLLNFLEPGFDRLDDAALAKERELETFIAWMAQPTINERDSASEKVDSLAGELIPYRDGEDAEKRMSINTP